MNIHAHTVTTRSTILICFFSVFSAHATLVTLPYSFTAGSPISASQMMGNFATITSALSSTVSSPWVTSSSNIYFATGSVGIGSSAPAHALDVSGSVSATSFIGSGAGLTGFPLPKAAAQFYWNGSSIVIINSYNIASITRSGGTYNVIFSTALASAPMCCLLGFQRMNANDFLQYFGLTQSGLYLQHFSNGALVDNTNSMSFLVF